MAQFVNIYKCDLHKGPVVTSLHQVFLGDVEANRVGVHVTDNGEDITLSGTCSGTAILCNGGTVALTGTVDGSLAYVDLPSAVYTVEGPVEIYVTLTQGDQTTTLLTAHGNAVRTDSGVVIDPGTIIPSVAALISDIDDAVASIPADYSDLLGTIAPDFSSSTAYTAGQYVWYSGTLYRFTSDHAAGSWTGTDAIAAEIGEDVADLKGALFEVATPNIYSDDGITTGAMVRADGTINSNISDGAYTKIIPVSEGHYKFVFSHGATSGGWGVRVSGYYGETHVQELTLIECSSSAETKVTEIMIPSTVNGIRISFYYYSSVTSAILVKLADGFGFVGAIDSMARTGHFVFPEWFGAVGNGVADDTAALVQAVNYARTNKLILSGVYGKTYLITQQIDLKQTQVNFNRATIKAGTTLRYMFIIDSSQVVEETTYDIQNLVIDCNNTSGGIYYPFALHNRLDNVDFLNVHQIAIANTPAEGSSVAGGGLYIRNCYLQGDASETSQGMFFGTSDDRVMSCILKDFHRGIYNNGTNLFYFVHTWMSKNVENTICFYHNGGNVAMFGCHFDTYKYAIYRNTDQNLDLIGCLVYINSNLYGAWVDGSWVAGTTPYIIWCTDNCKAYTANVHFTNCSFNPLRTAMELTNVAYQRYQFRECFFKDGITGKINDVTLTLSKVTTDTAGDYVNLRQDDRWIKLNALVTPGSNFVAGYTSIASVPSNYMYPEDDNNTGYSAHGHAYLYLDSATSPDIMICGLVINPTSGVISINTPSTLDVSRIKSIELDMRWPVKKSLAYYRD